MFYESENKSCIRLVSMQQITLLRLMIQSLRSFWSYLAERQRRNKSLPEEVNPRFEKETLRTVLDLENRIVMKLLLSGIRVNNFSTPHCNAKCSIRHGIDGL